MDTATISTRDIVAVLAPYRCDLFRRSLGRRVVDCPSLHGLRRAGSAASGLACDVCDGAIRVGEEVFSCRSCNFDVCNKCFRAGVPREQAQARQLEQKLSRYSLQVHAYADERRRALAREVLPEVSADVSNQEASLRELLRWFKSEFFRWTKSPLCPNCGVATSENKGMIKPTEEELWYGASRVESWQCGGCCSFARFPRYSDPERLLQTRHGRCGEWANCFTLCTSALGFDSRLVIDWTDHVWTEVRLNGRWVHCDACEAVLDAPLLYETGWGKKLTYVVAFSTDEVVDVTPRYAAAWPEALARRRLVSEESLRDLIARADGLARAGAPEAIPPPWRSDEEAELAARTSGSAAHDKLQAAELCGRHSGSVA